LNIDAEIYGCTSTMLSPSAEGLCHLTLTGELFAPGSCVDTAPRLPLHPIFVYGPALQINCAPLK